MIVTCGECSTSFQLDESRIPEGGARVRCSRCKHAFFLPNPNETGADAVHRVAEEAAVDPSALPSASEDLNASTMAGFGDDATASPGPATAGAAPSSEPELDEEEDWQFSEEVRVEGDEPEDDLGSDLNDDLGDSLGSDFDSDFGEESDFGVGTDFSEGLDPDALSEELGTSGAGVATPDAPEIANAALEDTGADSGLELDGPPEAVSTDAPVRDESSFGTVDDFSSLMEDDEPAAPNDVVSDLASEIASDLAADETRTASTYSSSGQADDLGDPESWDLVGSDDFAVESPVLRGSAPAASVGPVDAAEFFSDDAYEDEGHDIDLASSSLVTGPIGQLARLVGWAATISVVAAVTFAFFQAEWARFTPSPQAVSAGPIEALTLEAGWLETTQAGPVLRYVGQVRNTASTPIRATGIQLALLDADGVRLEAAPLVAGDPLSEYEVRESTLEMLVNRSEAAARSLALASLRPGEIRPFEIIVPESRLPEDAARVLLEVGEARTSAPGPRVEPVLENAVDAAMEVESPIEVAPTNGAAITPRGEGMP